MRRSSTLLSSATVVLISLAPPRVHSQAWSPIGDEALRIAVERLVDDRVVSVPLLAWPLTRRELETILEVAHEWPGLTNAHQQSLSVIERAVDQPSREWFVAAGRPTELRRFSDAPREDLEFGVELRTGDWGRFSGDLRLRVAPEAVDGQDLRADGSYLSARAGSWLLSAGFLERWWGGGYAGALQMSNNARPVFSLSVDRNVSRPFESRWLRWIGPWTAGTFFGALESRRPDSNHALLWGARIAARPVPGFEVAVTRNAQFCGDKPPCSPHAFWNVLAGNDNVGESISARDEPGNQLASYELRWAGGIGRVPLSINYQHTGETIDNKFPRPLRALSLLNLSTWGDTANFGQWRGFLEASSTICADFDDALAPDCAYENGVFSAGYRYRGRVIGHSTDGDSRQIVAGVIVSGGNSQVWTARLRRAEINRIGGVPQGNHLLAPDGPQLWWLGELSLRRPVQRGTLELDFGMELRRDERGGGGSDFAPRGFVRWAHGF